MAGGISKSPAIQLILTSMLCMCGCVCACDDPTQSDTPTTTQPRHALCDCSAFNPIAAKDAPRVRDLLRAARHLNPSLLKRIIQCFPLWRGLHSTSLKRHMSERERERLGDSTVRRGRQRMNVNRLCTPYHDRVRTDARSPPYNTSPSRAYAHVQYSNNHTPTTTPHPIRNP